MLPFAPQNPTTRPILVLTATHDAWTSRDYAAVPIRCAGVPGRLRAFTGLIAGKPLVIFEPAGAAPTAIAATLAAWATPWFDPAADPGWPTVAAVLATEATP